MSGTERLILVKSFLIDIKFELFSQIPSLWNKLTSPETIRVIRF